MHSDRILNCKECGRDFTFTASEQQFYAEKGLTNDPGRCPECRSARKAQSRGGRGGSGGGMGGNRQMYPAVCASCGKETQVPFQPSGEKPVYCRDCFKPQPRRNSY